MIRWLLTTAASAAVFLSVSLYASETSFDPETGLRIHHYTDPVPASVPGGVTLDTAGVAALIAREAVTLIDVLSINDVRYDELDGTWSGYPPRENIPGSLWLPNVGYGQPAEDMHRYLLEAVTDAVGGDQRAPILVYCVSSCWMGWNAVQHLARAGFTRVYWYPEGTDGWIAAGYSVAPSEPLAVTLE